MVRRSLGAALWSLVGLLACFLGALNGLVGTRAGRTLLARTAGSAVENAVAGTITVGDVSGPLLTGLVLTDVRIYDADSTLVASLPRVELSYNPIDFAAGRAVLFEVGLHRPAFNIVEHANGQLNLAELLRLEGQDTLPAVATAALPHPAPRPLILLRNVRIVDGSVTLRLPDAPSPDDSLLEIVPSARDGRQRIRRFERLNARLVALRLSAPRERGIRIDIARLAFASSDPALVVTDAAGRVTIVGDTLDADLSRLAFPGTQLAARGRVRWPRGVGILWDLALRADSATLSDVHFIDPRFPPGAVLRGAVTVRSQGARALEVRLDPLDVAYGGGRLTGRVTALSATGLGIVEVRGGDLLARDLSLELVRPFLDTLPFAGHLSGRTRADGPAGRMRVDVDWIFRDSLVPDAAGPVTRLRGAGDVGIRGDLAFLPVALDSAIVSLATVRRLAPAIALRGTLDASGTLSGTLTHARFTGTVRHRDGAGPASLLRGVMGLDSRTDTLGVYADVAADTLAIPGVRGQRAGTIRLDGSLAALETHVALRRLDNGLDERVALDGVLELGMPRSGARSLTLQVHDVNLADWLPAGIGAGVEARGGPPSRLALTVTGGVTREGDAAPQGDLTVALGPSLFAGTVVDSGSAVVHFSDGRVYVESLRVQQPGLLTRGSGSLGWARPAGAGTLSLDVDADSLSVLDSLFTWMAGDGLLGPTPGEALAGSARLLLTLDGALDSIALDARATATDLRWRGWHVPAGRGRGSYRPRGGAGGAGGAGGGGGGAGGGEPRFEIDAQFDSIGYGRFGFGAASARAAGTSDSLRWFARSRIGDLAAFLAGGRAVGGAGARRVAVDSLAVLLPGSVWFLERPVALTFGDSLLALDTLSIRSSAGPGRLAIGGTLPVRGRADARLQLESFPLAGVYALLQRDTLGVAGALTATVGLGGTRAEPVYIGSFALSDAALHEFRIPFLDGTASYRDRRLTGELHMWRAGQQVLNVDAHFPLDLALTPVARRLLPDTLSVQARADSVDLTLLEAATPQLREVRGVFDADLGIGGTWDAPRLRGGLTIGGAAATIPALGVRYEDVNGRLALRGDTIRVDALRARGGRGRAEVTGFVRLDELTRPVLALDIAATEFAALDLRGYLAVTASGALALTGPVFGATLSGRGTVTSGVLHFADLVNKRVVNLDEPWVQDLIDTSLIRTQRLGPEFESVFLDSLRIRGLALTMGSDVWLRSGEANIQLTGSVAVDKARDEYRLTGTLQAPRGTYRLVVGPVTREFVVNQGTVRYFGTPDLDAELDIEARHVVRPLPSPGPVENEDITIIAHIRGTLLVPRLTLEAEGRQYSQTEIISYLMFGKPSFELAGNQEALAKITAASIVTGEIERTFVSDLGVPLDYFEIRPGDAENPLAGVRLSAGWQIGSKTFLVVNAGLCQRRVRLTANTLGASLQFRISPEWRTEASFEPVRHCVGDTESQTSTPPRQVGLDLFWERRY